MHKSHEILLSGSLPCGTYDHCMAILLWSQMHLVLPRILLHKYRKDFNFPASVDFELWLCVLRDAWSSLGNMTKEEAMKSYIENIQLVSPFRQNWGWIEAARRIINTRGIMLWINDLACSEKRGHLVEGYVKQLFSCEMWSILLALLFASTCMHLYHNAPESKEPFCWFIKFVCVFSDSGDCANFRRCVWPGTDAGKFLHRGRGRGGWRKWGGQETLHQALCTTCG